MTTAEKKIVTSKPVTAVAATPVPAKVTTTPAAPHPQRRQKGHLELRRSRLQRSPLRLPKRLPSQCSSPRLKSPSRQKKKLVRDSFTIPKTEYTVLEDLKQRAGKLQVSVKKSELLCAGIKALAATSEAGYLAALKAVPAIKTGRPTKD